MTTKPTTIILSGFSLVIFMTIALLVISLYQLNTTKQTLENDIQTESLHIATVNSLLEIANKRSVLILNILQTEDPFIQDEIIQQFYKLGEEFIKTRQLLVNSRLSAFEKKLLSEHENHAANVVATQHQVIKLASEGQYEQAHHIYMTLALQRQQQNNDYLNQLSQYQHYEIDVFVTSLIKKQNDIYLIILTGSIFLIIFCIFIALFIYRRLTSNLNEIQQARDELVNSLGETQNLQYALDQHAIVSISDISGQITYVNDKFCEVSQYSEDEVIGRYHNIINSSYHEKSFFRDMWATITSGATWSGEIRNQKKDGHYYWVETTIVPFLDKNNIPYQYIAIRTEITHIKETEKDLEFSFEQLAVETQRALESNTLKDSIISTMTHELRTPLNSILGFSQLLLMEKNSLSEIQADNIESIHTSGKELLLDIDNLMLYSKLKSHSIVPSYHETELYSVIQSVIVNKIYPHKNITVSPFLEPTDKIFNINVDISLIQKAFDFVLDNSIKFTDKGHIIIKLNEIEINSVLPNHQSTTDSRLVLITIEDTGIGISPEKSQIVFDEFRQADEKDNRQFEGIGIGLSLTKNIINMHNGEIWLTSELGKGTTVYITIPLNPEESDV